MARSRRRRTPDRVYVLGKQARRERRLGFEKQVKIRYVTLFVTLGLVTSWHHGPSSSTRRWMGDIVKCPGNAGTQRAVTCHMSRRRFGPTLGCIAEYLEYTHFNIEASGLHDIIRTMHRIKRAMFSMLGTQSASVSLMMKDRR